MYSEPQGTERGDLYFRKNAPQVILVHNRGEDHRPGRQEARPPSVLLPRNSVLPFPLGGTDSPPPRGKVEGPAWRLLAWDLPRSKGTAKTVCHVEAW